MYQQINKGAANPTARVKVVDNPTGLPENSVSASGTGLTLWYERERAGRTTFTAFNLASTSASWTAGGFIHISDGYCRMDLPDAAVTVGANSVLCGVSGLTSMVGIATLVDLTDPISVSAFGVKVSGFTADAFDSSAVAASAVSKIQSGLALQTSVSAIHTLATAISAKTSSLSFVSGNVLSRVVTMAPDSLDSSAVAATAVTKMNVGIALQTSLSGIQANVAAMAPKIASLTFASGNVLARMISAAADSIDNSVIAATAVTKIQNGVALQASLSGVQANIAAMVPKIASLSFEAGRVLSDIKAINGTPINGDGSGTPFGP